jgi:hypothetical protein
VQQYKKEKWSMVNAQHYEAEILKALKTLPAAALPKVWRLLMVLREACFAAAQGALSPARRPPTPHEQTRRWLATSPGNWAQEVMAAREDCL